MNVVVIGAGIGGIASAIRLALKGHSVTVCEKNSFPGGKMSELRQGKYRFDTGPSLFTLPGLLDELFILAGKNPSDYIQYQKLDIICKYFYPGGLVINTYQDIEKLEAEFQDKMGLKPGKIRRFLNKSKTIYELTSDLFLFSSFHHISTFISRRFLKAILQWWKLDAFRTMHGANASWFGEERIVQLFDRYATYNGSNPYKAPATLNVISHLEHNLGAWFPEKGMYEIIRSTTRLAGELGVRFMFQSPVERIITHKNKIRGVVVEGEVQLCDIVVSDTDVLKAYELTSKKIAPKYMKHERSTSALIFYWGVNKQFPELELHNILFSGNYRDEFDHLFRLKSVCHDPTVYIFISSKIVPGDAPDGCENWFVMINVPENTGQDWDSIISDARIQIIHKINAMLNTSIDQHIEHETVFDPRIIESRTSSVNGSLYGNSSNSKFAAFSRHPNSSKKIRGLYFAGGSVHPGGGIPLCLSSAKIVDGFIGGYPT